MNFLNKLLEMAGGKAEQSNVTEKDVDPVQLLIGIEVEMEHTYNKEISKQIALDHLAEHKNYYTKLIEAGLADEKSALNLYKKYISENNEEIRVGKYLVKRTHDPFGNLHLEVSTKEKDKIRIIDPESKELTPEFWNQVHLKRKGY